jgi:hypothetical protein
MSTPQTRKKQRSERETQFWSNRLSRIQCRNVGRGYTAFDGWKQWGGVKNMYGTEINETVYNATNNKGDNYSNSTNVNPNYKTENYNEKIVVINSKHYKYRETVSGRYIYLYRGEYKRKCFEIEVDVDGEGNKYAKLDSLYNYGNCCITMDSTGRDLFLAVVKLLTDRGSLKYMTLTDRSGKYIGDGKWISLADVTFTTTGETWYESMVPLVPDDIDTYNLTYKKVTTAKWVNVYTYLKETEPMLTIPINISDIDGNAEGSAMGVYWRIKEANSDFFAIYRPLIMPSMGCSSMSGMAWRYYFPTHQ